MSERWPSSSKPVNLIPYYHSHAVEIVYRRDGTTVKHILHAHLYEGEHQHPEIAIDPR